MSRVTHNLHQTTGRERGVVDSTRVRGGDPTARKADSLVAHDDTMGLGHHPLQRAQGPKRELVARGPGGGEERHDEPKGVEYDAKPSSGWPRYSSDLVFDVTPADIAPLSTRRPFFSRSAVVALSVASMLFHVASTSAASNKPHSPVPLRTSPASQSLP